VDARIKSDDIRYQATLQVLRTADSLWNVSRGFFHRWDISPSQFNVLNLLRSEGEGLSQIELSRQLIMHRSNVTGLVDRLEKRGLVKRKDYASDRRAYRVVLSPEGAELLATILPEYHRGAESVWQDLPSAQVARLLESLRKAAENAERTTSQGGWHAPGGAQPAKGTERDR
jgi:DNA-binding MarR family transcriptional regulator